MATEASTFIIPANIIYIPTTRELNKAVRLYALELARLTIEWNHLHENLANLFWRSTGITNGAIPLAIWHSIRSDLAQRQVLRAAAQQMYAHNKQAKDEIEWVLDTIDNKLSNRRNDAIHAPIIFEGGPHETTPVIPSHTMNPRALSLKGKVIMKELVWYRDMARCLRLYARELHRALKPNTLKPWPTRPLLPTLGSQPPAKGKRKAPARKGRGPQE